MTQYRLWGRFSDPSYSNGLPTDYQTWECFGRIHDAKTALWFRRFLGYSAVDWSGVAPPFGQVMERANVRVDYPGVSDSAEIHLLWTDGDPTELRDPYPDRVLKIGPRGGIRVERG